MDKGRPRDVWVVVVMQQSLSGREASFWKLELLSNPRVSAVVTKEKEDYTCQTLLMVGIIHHQYISFHLHNKVRDMCQ